MHTIFTENSVHVFVKAYVIELRDYLEPSSIFQAKANRVIVAFFEGSRL